MTPLQKLKEWVEQHPDHKIDIHELLEKIEQLMPEEREAIETAYQDGSNSGIRTVPDYFTQKYGDNGRRTT